MSNHEMLIEYLILDDFISKQNNPYTCLNDDDYSEVSMWIHKALKSKLKSLYMDVKISKKDVKEVLTDMISCGYIEVQNVDKDNGNINSYYKLSEKGEVYFLSKYIFANKYTDSLCNVYNNIYLGNITSEQFKIYRYIKGIMYLMDEDRKSENSIYNRYIKEC